MRILQEKGENLRFWRGANSFGDINSHGVTLLCASMPKFYAQKREENA